ncbi:unnamed protein product [Sphenostylis stenocarpa]|uniref:Uncharacterized protein n=1 Tax=Sphenostylis stenocarpa TaxID=92480 RepID=A0AA86S338_9FABA|nr:unnamed protein product [Sphenostylis stenocarpa]
MAPSLKFSIFSACVLVLCVVVAAQYGDDGGSGYGSDMPNMNMGPSTQHSSSKEALLLFTSFAVNCPLGTS